MQSLFNQPPIFYPIAIVSIMIMGISKSGFGSGLGVLAVPLMSLVIPPGQAAGILLPLLCIMDVVGVKHYWRKWDISNLKVILPAALLGILIGTFTFRYLSDPYIRIMIGAISVVFVGYYFLRRNNTKKTEVNRLKGSIWGALSGFTSFGVHSGGPPLNIYLLPQKLDKTLFVGTTMIFFAVVNYVKLIPYAILDQLNPGNLATSLVLSPMAFIGIWVGIRMHKWFNERLFYILAYLFLFVTGVILLIKGFSAL